MSVVAFTSIFLLICIFSPVVFATQPRIVIVGSGISGIAAATKLAENNLTNVVILEAESTYGGRVKYINDATGVLPMGAQWIMGTEGNVLYDLVSGNDAVGVAIEEKEIYCYTSQGTKIPQQCVMYMWADYDEILETVGGSNKTIDQIFKSAATQEKYEDNVEIVRKMFKLLFESITPVTRWQNEVGSGFASYQMLKGSSAVDVKGTMKHVFDILWVSYRFSLTVP